MNTLSNNSVWAGKAEPSPLHLPDYDLCLLEDNFTNESYSQWLGVKMDFPLFEDLSSINSTTENNSLNGYTKCSPTFNTEDHTKQDTESLLREFEYVYDKVELNHLTPPQSPSTSLYPNHLVPTCDWDEVFCEETEKEVYNGLNVQDEFEVFEKLGGQDDQAIIPENQKLEHFCISEDIDDSLFSPGGMTVSSPDNSSLSSSDQDEDWTLNQRSSRRSVHGYKPYQRGETGDRKNRKKEQNKNAATRYRQKKKAEIEEILGKEQDLLESNKELKTQCADIEREIKYLKDLMRELFKTKGLI